MTHPRTVLGLCGSLRANRAVLRAAAAVAPPTVRVELYPSLAGLPLFNPDLDATALAPVAVLNVAPRSQHAHAALCETLRTMSARLIEGACIALPILGSKLDAPDLASHAQPAASLRAALLALTAT
jgi:chromate reductase, NAD(P)H dehydrogenase (quinone)